MKLGLEPRTREWIMAAALLVSVFMAGALTALAVDGLLARRGAARPELAGGPASFAPGARFLPPGGRGVHFGRGPGPIGMTSALAQRLRLSDRQEQQVREILERRRAESDSLLQQMHPRLQANLDSTLAQIRRLLEPGQREEFDRYVREGRALMFRRLELPPGGGAPPEPPFSEPDGASAADGHWGPPPGP
ncbi:MAG: hypothetical protein HY703_03830 [Gemmatimonadetes bacterium]|nr:hypothetical protein [Gemmatimonadota bacterium]